MDVMALSIKLKEEGAAAVKASTDKLNTSLKGTQAAANGAARAVNTASLNAAKGSLAFGQMARSMAATGSAASLMSGGIVEAGTHIATMFGPTGILAMAFVGFAVAVRNSMKQVSKAVEEELRKIQDSTQRTALTLGSIRRIASAEAAQEGIDILRGGLGGALMGVGARDDDIRARGLRQAESDLRGLQRQLERAQVNARNMGLTPEARDANRASIEGLTQAIANYNRVLGEMRTEEAALVQRSSQLQQSVERSAAAALTATGSGATAGLGSTRVGISGMGAAQYQGMARSIADPLAAAFERELKQELADGIAAGLSAGVIAGFSAITTPGGNIGKAFNAFTGMMLGGIGDAMIKFGMASKGFAILQKKIMTALASLNPSGALIGALTMIAAGAALKGVAGGMFQRGTGGTGFSGIGTGSDGGSSTRLVFGNTSATTAAGMTPRTPMAVTIIGPNDPTAQRQLQQLMANANARGNV